MAVSLLFILLWWASLNSVTVVVLSDGEWFQLPGPANGVLKAVAVSSTNIWGIYTTPCQGSCNNLVYCRRPCLDGNWIDGGGYNIQQDSNDKEVWGVLEYGDIDMRRVYINEPWKRIAGPQSDNCLSHISVSRDGYVWGLSCRRKVYVCPPPCNGTDWIPIEYEIPLTKIDAGTDDVWGVSLTNHIFKRPVNGSGEWRLVPGEMRYISASGNEHVWGIALNDSLYFCEKPCTGCWQKVEGSFLHIDGGHNYVAGLMSNNTLIAMHLGSIFDQTLDDVSRSSECPTMLSQVVSTASNSSMQASYSTIILGTLSAAGGLIVLLVLLIIILVTIFTIVYVRNGRKTVDINSNSETFVSSQVTPHGAVAIVRPHFIIKEENQTEIEMLQFGHGNKDTISDNHDYEAVDNTLLDLEQSEKISEQEQNQQATNNSNDSSDDELKENDAYISSSCDVIMAANCAYHINNPALAPEVKTEANVAYQAAH